MWTGPARRGVGSRHGLRRGPVPGSAPPAAPGVMAALRDFAITVLRLSRATSIAAALRYHARRQPAVTDDYELLKRFGGTELAE